MKRKRYKYAKAFRALFKFAGFRLSGIEDTNDEIHVLISHIRTTALCPHCGKRCTLLSEKYSRRIRDLDISFKKCYITFNEHKINCQCGFRGFEKNDFVRPFSHQTIRFEELVANICQLMPLTNVCDLISIDWKTAKCIDIHYMKQKLVTLDQIIPKRIGIDEIAYEKGHKYLTVVRDFDLGKVIWVGIGRKKDTLDQFFKDLGGVKRFLVKLVTIDMWDPYIASIRENCPYAVIVIDKFHVIKKINEALDKIRRKMFAQADKSTKKEMKRKRFVILKRQKNLNQKQLESLKEISRINQPLYEAYLLKEQISDIFEEKDEEVAIKRLGVWMSNVINSGLAPLFKCVKTMCRYIDGIRNYFKYNLTNAASEGFNTKINVIKRRAFGYVDLDYFILKIHQIVGVSAT